MNNNNSEACWHFHIQQSDRSGGWSLRSRNSLKSFYFSLPGGLSACLPSHVPFKSSQHKSFNSENFHWDPSCFHLELCSRQPFELYLYFWRTGVRKANFSLEVPSGPGWSPVVSLTQLLSTIRLTMIWWVNYSLIWFVSALYLPVIPSERNLDNVSLSTEHIQ